MSLHSNMLFRLVIAFLPRSKHLLISCLQSPSAVILEPKKIKSFTVSIVFTSICHEVMDPEAMILVFLILVFYLSFLSQHFHSPLSLWSRGSLVPLYVRMMSSAYLRLLIFLLAILISLCPSSSPMFLMMYSAYKLNKQSDNIQSWYTPFPIWNQSIVSCLFLTVPSWPACRFIRRQVRWSCIPISLRIFHKKKKRRIFHSPTIEPLSRQPTDWRTLIPKKFLHCYESSMTHEWFTHLGICQKDWEPQGI